MFEDWFSNLETVTQFLVAFVIALALMAALSWLWKRLSGHRLGGGTTRDASDKHPR
jgi:flagellar biogenesis protein FliO